ncbi:hypothetical protein CPB86DRAFT_807890 [Serendipita vermifera]|nr:hypothetical protein CPB86DRAFT_807890 [Serendipita vermifera]
MHSFDFVCIGAGGGPSETDLSSYLVKASDARWEDGIVALEAGSGIGALSNILTRSRDVFHDVQPIPDTPECPQLLACRIYSYIQSFLITHSHLDHVLSLVLSAGSLPSPPPLHTGPAKRRRIVGTKEVLDDLASMIFSDRIWPNLASWSSESTVPDFMYLYEPVSAHSSKSLTSAHPTADPYHALNPKLSVLPMPVSHGLCLSKETYGSTAFFIRHAVTQKHLLFFGDVEPDSLALNPSTKAVWQTAAKLITTTAANGTKMLDAIFIECSWPSTRKDAELYGHLNPQHLLHEMKALANEVAQHKPLQQPTPPTSPNISGPSASTTNIIHGENCSHMATERPQKKRRRTILRLGPRHRTTESNASDASTTPSVASPAQASSPDLLTQAESSRLKGALDGVTLYVMHFKTPMQASVGIQNGKLSHHIVSEFTSLVEKEQLGLKVVAMEQGMRVAI